MRMELGLLYGRLVNEESYSFCLLRGLRKVCRVQILQQNSHLRFRPKELEFVEMGGVHSSVHLPAHWESPIELLAFLGPSSRDESELVRASTAYR